MRFLNVGAHYAIVGGDLAAQRLATGRVCRQFNAERGTLRYIKDI